MWMGDFTVSNSAKAYQIFNLMVKATVKGYIVCISHLGTI